MKSMTLFLSAVFSGVLTLAMLSGCTSRDGEMNAFVGQPSSELLARLGQPKLRIPDGQGGQIWTYMDEGPTPGMTGPTFPGALTGAGAPSQGSAVDSRGFASRREFHIDANGTIYKYRGKGN